MVNWKLNYDNLKNDPPPSPPPPPPPSSPTPTNVWVVVAVVGGSREMRGKTPPSFAAGYDKFVRKAEGELGWLRGRVGGGSLVELVLYELWLTIIKCGLKRIIYPLHCYARSVRSSPMCSILIWLCMRKAGSRINKPSEKGRRVLNFIMMIITPGLTCSRDSQPSS